MTKGPENLSMPATSLPDSGTPSGPATVMELRDLMLRIGRGDAPIALGPKARMALAQILDLQGDPAILSITTLAEKVAVNPSTLTRLARHLGYPGFGGLQEVLLNASMAAPGSFYSRQAKTALEGEDPSGSGGATRLCRENQANIDRFLSTFDEQQFAKAIALISAAPRVMVHGIRQFHALASFLVYGLRMIRSDVHLLDSNALGIAEGIAAMGGDDVFISASCAPYSAQVVEAARVVAEQAIALVAITDRADSPLIAPSTAAILVPHETSFLSNSLTTFILAAECLINGCAAARPDRARIALGERDRMIGRLAIEL